MKKKYVMLAVPLILFSCNPGSTDLEASNDKNDTLILPLAESEDTVTTSQVDMADLTKDKGMVCGIDISKYQGDEVSFLNANKDTLSFVICKATEGNTFTDPDFKMNWKEITEKGFIRGAYHFYRTNDKPKPQSENFLNSITSLERTDLSPIVDVEGGGIDKNASVESVQSDLLAFLTIIENETKRIPILYTNVTVGNKYFLDEKFNKYPLWIADYNGEDTPRLPGVWKGEEWQLWQKADNYQVDGKSNDLDVFNGDLEALKTFIEKY